MYRPKPAHLLLSLLGLVASMLAACLWPFRFYPRNDAEWLKNERGIRCSGMGLIASRDAFPSPSRLSADGSITVEIVVRPTSIVRRNVPHLLTFCPEAGPPALVIGAWRDSLIVRLGRPDAPGRRKYREVGAAAAFAVGKTTRVTVVTGPRGTAAYLNGRLAAEMPDVPLADSDAPLGRLLLGVSPTGGGRWQGDILELTIYGRALSAAEVYRNQVAAVLQGSSGYREQGSTFAHYAFEEGRGESVRNSAARRHDLTIPRNFHPLRRTVLSLGSQDTRVVPWQLKDVLLNVLGFIPFGFLASWQLAARRRVHDRTAAIVVVSAGFAFSLALEVAQAFLPARNSSLIDLITNTSGTAIGVICFLLASHVIARLEG
jgi:VanZ family protein